MRSSKPDPSAPTGMRRHYRRPTPAVLWSAGVTAAALACIGGVYAFGAANGPGESSQAAASVPLSADGFALETTPAALKAATATATAALADGLGRPRGADTKISERMLAAYRTGEATAAAQKPRCHVPWWVLAGIGKVESDHAAGTTVAANGDVSPALRSASLDGAVLDTRPVLDTDRGALDGDTRYDRAMGPLQFTPGLWRVAGRDGNGDNEVRVDNADDQAVGAALYLCARGDDMTTAPGLAAALLRLDPRPTHARDVLTWGTYYRTRITPPGQQPAPASGATLPPPPARPQPALVPTQEDTPAAPAPTASPRTPDDPTPAPTPTRSPAPDVPRPTRTPRSPSPTVEPSTAPTPDPATPAPRPTSPRDEPTRSPRPDPAPESPAHEPPAPEPAGTSRPSANDSDAGSPSSRPTAEATSP